MVLGGAWYTSGLICAMSTGKFGRYSRDEVCVAAVWARDSIGAVREEALTSDDLVPVDCPVDSTLAISADGAEPSVRCADEGVSIWVSILGQLDNWQVVLG